MEQGGGVVWEEVKSALQIGVSSLATSGGEWASKPRFPLFWNRMFGVQGQRLGALEVHTGAWVPRK